MAETIPGGAAFDTATNRWLDAEGRPLTKEQIAEVERLAAERADQLAEAERQARMIDAQRDPTARAIAAALAPAGGGGAVAPNVPKPPAGSAPSKESK